MSFPMTSQVRGYPSHSPIKGVIDALDALLGSSRPEVQIYFM